MRITAREVLSIGKPTMIQNDLNDVKYEVQELEQAMARGDMEAAYFAAKNVADVASVLMSELKKNLGMPSYPEQF